MIANAVARADQVTAGERDEQAIAQLTSENRRTDFVELAQALGDAAHRHQREAVQGAADHLVIDLSDRLADANRFCGERLGLFGVAVIDQGEDRGTRSEEGVFRAVGLSFEQAARALDPAVGDAGFAAKGSAVPRNPDRHAACRHHVAAVAVGLVGALARIEDDGRQVQPPRSQAEPFQGFRRLLGREGPFERLPGLQPGPRFEGHPASRQIVDRLRRGHFRNYIEVIARRDSRYTLPSRSRSTGSNLHVSE